MSESNLPQLFCFPYAGGTKKFFELIKGDVQETALICLEYAGHGERRKEPFYADFSTLADDMFHKVKDRLYSPYALFGYSMGSIAAVEVLRKIIASNLPQPTHLFLAAHEPHTKSELLGFKGDELDDWVKERTIHFGAVPEKLVNNKSFWRMYLPIYRADYTIIGKFGFEEFDIRTDIPATIFYSETDTPLKEMKQWERYFPCEFYRFEGNHFFIQQHHERIARIIESKMNEGRQL